MKFLDSSEEEDDSEETVLGSPLRSTNEGSSGVNIPPITAEDFGFG